MSFIVDVDDETVWSSSLEKLTGNQWAKPSPGATGLEVRGYAARVKPVSQLSVEDLRLLVGQHMSLAWTIPFAIRELERDPLAEGDMYSGDLLSACLSLPGAFFSAHPEVRKRLGRKARSIDDDDWQMSFPDSFAAWRSG